MVLVESEAEPYHFVQREDKKNLGVSQGVIHQFVKCCNRYCRMFVIYLFTAQQLLTLSQ